MVYVCSSCILVPASCFLLLCCLASLMDHNLHAQNLFLSQLVVARVVSITE